jgi:hypothetical protein
VLCCVVLCCVSFSITLSHSEATDAVTYIGIRGAWILCCVRPLVADVYGICV